MSVPTPSLSAGEIHTIHTNMEILANQLPPAQASAIHYALNATRPGFGKTVRELSGVVVHVTANLYEKCDQPVTLLSNFNDWDPQKGQHAWHEEKVSLNFYQREYILQVPKEQSEKTLEFKLYTQGKWQTGANVVVDFKHYGHIADITVDSVQFA